MSNQAKHHAGPWTVARHHDDIDSCEIRDSLGALASCCAQDAALIAAAPDLLAALEEASLAIRAAGKRLADSGVAPDAEWQAFRKARAAIARATGNADT